MGGESERFLRYFACCMRLANCTLATPGIKRFVVSKTSMHRMRKSDPQFGSLLHFACLDLPRYLKTCSHSLARERMSRNPSLFERIIVNNSSFPCKFVRIDQILWNATEGQANWSIPYINRYKKFNISLFNIAFLEKLFKPQNFKNWFPYMLIKPLEWH